MFVFHISLPLLFLRLQCSLCNVTNNVRCLLEQINAFSSCSSFLALYRFTFDTLTFHSVPFSTARCVITVLQCVVHFFVCIETDQITQREWEITGYLPNKCTLISQFIWISDNSLAFSYLHMHDAHTSSIHIQTHFNTTIQHKLNYKLIYHLFVCWDFLFFILFIMAVLENYKLLFVALFFLYLNVIGIVEVKNEWTKEKCTFTACGVEMHLQWVWTSEWERKLKRLANNNIAI